eukprot:2844950-Karenia_brevis.AAC.1
MKRSATHTGFDGDPQAWAEEYRSLCLEHKCRLTEGIPLYVFLTALTTTLDQAATAKIQNFRLCAGSLAGIGVTPLPLQWKLNNVYPTLWSRLLLKKRAILYLKVMHSPLMWRQKIARGKAIGVH